MNKLCGAFDFITNKYADDDDHIRETIEHMSNLKDEGLLRILRNNMQAYPESFYLVGKDVSYQRDLATGELEETTLLPCLHAGLCQCLPVCRFAGFLQQTL